MKGFRKYYGQKILWYIFTLIIAVILNFILPRLMPGDPTSAIVAQDGSASPFAHAWKPLSKDSAIPTGSQ